MLEYIIIQKADKNNVILLINKNYYVRKYHYTKGDKCNVILFIKKNSDVRKYHYTKIG